MNGDWELVQRLKYRLKVARNAGDRLSIATLGSRIAAYETYIRPLPHDGDVESPEGEAPATTGSMSDHDRVLLGERS